MSIMNGELPPANFQGGVICGPTLESCGSDGSVMEGDDSTVPEELLYVSEVPPWSVVLHPVKTRAAHIIESNNAIFME